MAGKISSISAAAWPRPPADCAPLFLGQKIELHKDQDSCTILLSDSADPQGMNTSSEPIPPELFDRSPAQIWDISVSIIRRISPSYDFSVLRTAFDDTVSMFQGHYPGYSAIKTLYHDLQHTLDVYLCAIRLLHGVHLSGAAFDDASITQLGIAALMHDIGYAQRAEEAYGTGAQFTQSHVARGIEFIGHYLSLHNLPATWLVPLSPIMRCTSFDVPINTLQFPDQRSRQIGQILGSADLVAQMADRAYLEKLLLLYLEFKEAHFGNYQSMYDLLHKTRAFYEYTLKKLNSDFDGIYTRLADHFRDFHGLEKNYYIESINKNLDYLSRVIALDEKNYHSLLKRNGVVESLSSFH